MQPASAKPGGRDVGDVVVDVVARVAPEEQSMAEGLQRLGHDAALRSLRRRRSADGLGFGWPEMVEYLTPAFYVALDQSLRSALDVSIQEGAKGLARRVFRSRKKAAVPALDDETRARLRDDVFARLIKEGIDVERARAAADELVAVLGGRATEVSRDGDGTVHHATAEESSGNDHDDD